MHESDLNLTELMRRATDGLQTDSTGLVQRAIEEGMRKRRRHKAGRGIAAATVLLLAGAAVVTAQWIGPGRPGVQVGGTPGVSPPGPPGPPGQESKPAARPDTARPAATSAALATLQEVLPITVRVSEPEHWGGSGYTGASITVDDGNGLSELDVLVERRTVVKRCPAPAKGRACEELPDRSVVISFEREATNGDASRGTHPSGRPDLGVKDNRVELHRPDGTVISMTNYNARDEKGSPNTRPWPPFSVAQLTKMARSPLWHDVLGPSTTRAPGTAPTTAGRRPTPGPAPVTGAGRGGSRRGDS